MSVIIGFVVGYLLGIRSGPEELKELEDAWHTITSSDEMKDIVTGMISVARDLLRQGASTLAARLVDTDERPTLRQVS